MKILVIDDSSTMRRIVRSHLKTVGLEDVTEAEGGAAALACLAAEKFDLVITDLAMPGMSGAQLVRAIRANPSHRRLPILMVTSIADKEDIVEALRAGVNGYVVKPFEPMTLKQKIDQVTGAVTASA